MTTNTFFLALPALVVASVSAAENPVSMDGLPPAVRKTVQERSKGASIRGLSQEIEDGNTFYEAELKINGRNQDVLIDPNGSVVEIGRASCRERV